MPTKHQQAWAQLARQREALEAERDAERQRAEAATDLMRRMVDTGRDLEHSPAFRMAYVEARAFLAAKKEGET